MAKVHVTHLTEIVSTLPDIRQFDLSAYPLKQQADLFLCAAGFEPRCLTIPRYLAEHGVTMARAVYFEYATNIDDNAANRGQLVLYLQQVAGMAVQSLEVDTSAFGELLRQVIVGLRRDTPGSTPHVVLDVSVASNRLLLRALPVLLDSNIRLTILYSEAAIYHPTREEYQADPSKWSREESLGLQRGVSDVTTEYPGYHIDQLPDCLIIFSSFRRERTMAVISNVDPLFLTVPEGKLVWLVGRPRLAQDQWRAQLMREINLIGEDARQYEVSTFDYKETLRTLDNVYEERAPSYRLTLSAMGSKMQTVGVALFCYMHPDIRVIVATPTEYNASQYSEGCKQIWILDLGAVQILRRSLDSVGTVRLVD